MKNIDTNDFPPIINEFLLNLDVVKNKSSLTIEEYASDLTLFFRFLKLNRSLVPKDTDFDKINISDIDKSFLQSVTLTDAYSFLSFCKNDRNNSATTRARKVSTIRGFFKFLHINKNYIDNDPMQNLEAPKIKVTLPKYLTLEQCKSLLKAALESSNPVRDYAIITLFLNCGMRLSELVSINLGDIRDNNTLVITGKGNKERTVYLNNACIEALSNYKTVRKPPLNPKTDDEKALFISSRGKRISPKTVQKLVYDALKRAGLSEYNFSVHKLRHTAATLMYQYGDVDVLVLKEILGHENVSTTQIYTHVANEQIKNATSKNPLSSMSIDNT
ncbi:MAG: tyrosine recombinase XerC [Clostridia bacterium]|nr:tyrosine recombinase XerC [Clostridia bacterium]